MLTNKQTPLKTPTSLRYATPVGKNDAEHDGSVRYISDVFRSWDKWLHRGAKNVGSLNAGLGSGGPKCSSIEYTGLENARQKMGHAA